jgi:hypothetical protein
VTLKKIRYLKVEFSGEIAGYEVPAFRGAMIDKVGRDHVLYHNHLDDNKFLYRYPLIQYKRNGKCPMLLCIEEGVDEVHEFFQNKDWSINISGRTIDMKIQRLDMKQFNMQVWDKSFYYKIYNWIGLNSEGYIEYESTESMADRIILLEKKLTGNILAFAKGIGWTVDKEIQVKILDVTHTKTVKHKNHKMLAFDVAFKSNVFLPKDIGLGKNVSIGFGMVRGIRTPERAEKKLELPTEEK